MRLATSPASRPPIPSERMKRFSSGARRKLSSLFSRTHPVSLRAPNFITVVMPNSSLRVLVTWIPLIAQRVFYETDIGETLRLQVIHGAFDALGTVRAGHND